MHGFIDWLTGLSYGWMNRLIVWLIGSAQFHSLLLCNVFPFSPQVMHHAVVKDDKQLINTLKKLGANPIPGIEEVNLFRNDNMVITIKNPKVQIALACNTFSVAGTAVEKPVSEVMSQFPNMNPESLMQLRNLGNMLSRARAAGAGADGKPGGGDDDVPVPQENFDENAWAFYLCVWEGKRQTFNFSKMKWFLVCLGTSFFFLTSVSVSFLRGDIQSKHRMNGRVLGTYSSLH